MIRYHAAWILPISGRPVRDGWVTVNHGRIVGCAADARADTSVEPASDVDLGHVAVMPGLVNAHTHLELSYLTGQIPPGSTFVDWIRSVMSARRQRVDPNAAEILEGIERGIADALRCGTVLVGDISNTMATFAPLVRSPLAAVVFHELIAFNPSDPIGIVQRAVEGIEALTETERVRASLAAHAPYSVAPSLFHRIREALERRPFAPCSVHIAESAAEVEFIREGTGPWRRLLEDLGAWNPEWAVPAVSPVDYLHQHAFLWDRLLAVHGVQMTGPDLQRLAMSGATLVTCPRSNVYTRAGRPPVDRFYQSGIPVAVGTDSLASAPDLNVFAELALMRELAPAVPAPVLLESATRQGARALGFEADFGTIAPGKSARLIAVDIPADTNDVEEYLVSGIRPEQVKWVGETLTIFNRRLMIYRDILRSNINRR